MIFQAPSDDILWIETERLHLEPVQVRHASEMLYLLSDPELYRYIPSNPPDLAALTTNYKRWEARISPSGDELWLNWIARSKQDGQVIGHFQAGPKTNGEAPIAYTVGVKFQRRGFAIEALTKICEFLEVQFRATSIKAWIDTRNAPSISLVQKLGMRQTGFIEGADHFKGSKSDEFVFHLERGAN